jgi:hypothetical protein
VNAHNWLFSPGTKHERLALVVTERGDQTGRLSCGTITLAVVLVSGTALAAGVGLDPADWRILFSKNLPNHPSSNGSGGWQFELRGNREVHYVLRAVTDRVSGAVSDSRSYLEVSMNSK